MQIAAIYKNRLDLELDDWLDPSLPRMYCELESDSVRIETLTEPFELCPPFTTEFTDENPEFVATTIMNPYQPVRMINGEISLQKTVTQE